MTVASSTIFGPIWIAGLVSLQSIPGTGALRTLFLLLGIAHLAWLARRAARPAWPAARAEGVLLALLTGWLILQSALISPTPGASLANFGGEWFKFLLMTAIGILVVAYAGQWRERANWPAIGLFLAYLVHVASTLAFQAWSQVRHGAFTLGDSFLGNYGYVSPFVTGALAFLLAEAVTRLRGQRWLPMSSGMLAALVVATLIAQTALIAKASVVVTAVLFAAATLATATIPELRRWLAVFLIGAVVAVASSLMVSNRWQGAAEAVITVIDSPVDFSTLAGSADPEAPVHRLDRSFYDRAVWAKLGLQGIADHPLGLGYGADAFGRYVVERGGPKGAVSSHSGWIDFALANGIPGLALLLALSGVIMHRGWRAFRAGNPAGLASLLVSLNFMARGIIDGNLTGSRLTGFALVAAALWALTALPAQNRHEGHAD